MQTIPIIVSEEVLKKIFVEVIDEINKFFIYDYKIIEEFSGNSLNSNSIILDSESLKNLANLELANKKLFILNSNLSSFHNHENNQFLINRPFKIFELFTLIEKNINQTKSREQKKIKFKQHVFDPLARTIYKNKKHIRLTEKESEIFSCLLESDNEYLNKKYLLKKVWQYNQEIDTHTLETHLYSLRKKIDEYLGTKNLIIYEEKKGYLINRELL